MHLSTSSSSNLVFLSLCCYTTFGFHTNCIVGSPFHVGRRSTVLAAVTAEEAADRARAAAEAALQAAPQPKLFDDDLLADMQQCLLKLERRVQEGPGALSPLQVEEFRLTTQRIWQEMKANERNRPKPAPAFPNVQVVEEVTRTPPATVVDRSEDEGPTYDGTGGLGLAKGTVNTYVIPGMDEMTPEEYQKALQKSISDRQARRVAQGSYGNRNSNDYLNNLGKGNVGTGIIKKA